MKRKVPSGIAFALLFIGMLTLAFNIQPVKSDWTWTETIYIRADGSIDPPTAPISSVDNVTYNHTTRLVKIDRSISELPPDVKTELTGYLQVLSEGWDQDAVNSANAILSNTTYNSAAWDDFFSEYFSNSPFTDDLRNYLGYPVFWWFSDQVHYNLQEGLINPLLNITWRIFQTHQDNLGDALNDDLELLQTLMNTQRFLNYMVTIGVITETSKNTIFNSYKDLVQTYPHSLKKNVTFDIVNEPYFATVRAQIYANIRDTIPLTSEIKNEIAQSINLTGFYLEIWNNFSVLVLDNNGFDSEQLNVIYNTLGKFPSCLHKLGIITQNDLLGNTGEKYQWLAVKSGINIFNIKVGSMIENGFPDDVTPKYSDVFTLVLIHEINHVVDAYYISNNDTLNNRKMDLIEAAGNTSMNYLRSMFPDDFFTTYPQEFFASISNQWFSDTFHTLELGLTRFSNGYTEPINQFLFFADIYSLGLNQTIFCTLDTEGNITKNHIPLTRDSNHHINSLDYNGTRYLFNLDDEGNVLGWETIADHDIAILSITTSKVTVIPGENIYVNVTVENQGYLTETFNVSLYYTRVYDPLIGTQNVTLAGGANTTLTFEWKPNMTGRYEILANTTEISGDIDPTDNTRTTIVYVGYGGSNPGSHNGKSVNGLHMAGFIFAMFASVMVLAFRKNREMSLSDIPASILKQNLRNNVPNNTTNMWQDHVRRQPK